MSTGRRRSSSFGGGKKLPSRDGTSHKSSPTITLESLQATHQLWELVCHQMVDERTQQSLLHSSSNLCLIQLLLDRAHQLDHYSNSNMVVEKDGNWSQSQRSKWLATMLQQPDGENGYTPLHWAVLKGRLPLLLLLIQYATAVTAYNYNNYNQEQEAAEWTPVFSHRFQHRPLALLQGDVLNLPDAVKNIFLARDGEGMTPFQLLAQLQVKELAKCRKSLVYSPLQGSFGNVQPQQQQQQSAQRRSRQNSFEVALQQDHDEQVRQQNEFAELHDFMNQRAADNELEQQQATLFQNNSSINASAMSDSYACEVLSFGRPNHLALGVQGGKNLQLNNVSNTNTSTKKATSPPSSSTSFRPYRVPTFSQDRVGRAGAAVAVAAAAHHSLVVTREGHLYAFGVGTGGRLGLGASEQHCPVPTRVLGALEKRRVMAIAAAENHSLCVTSDGAVYAFGSNRFGQLGYTTGSGGNTNNNTVTGGTGGSEKADSASSRCCLPRRVDDLWKKRVLCVSVAAGEKHSVALSQKGEVYVWGCNASGQLGISHRRSSSNSGIAHKVQRVDSLWNDDKKRICFRVAASSQSTLVLAKPNPGGLPVNQVYAWGHGNHVPAKVQFSDSEGPTPQQRQREAVGKKDIFMDAGKGRRSVNPTGIACARHHNAVITSDGRVYSWGFHADSLGSKSSSKATTKAAKDQCSRPQLVVGMLPEEGGGLAVAVSASENHTAVVTETGSLFTWGSSYGKDVLGHEGVRWQPCPKRVSGVSRAVSVSAAKEHTILLMGATFSPTIKPLSSKRASIPSLEAIAAQQVAKYVDLFNAVPILITAERINCQYLVEFCRQFIGKNLDGVLNVGQKGVMEMYLKEQAASGLLLLDEDPRDRRERPLILDVSVAAKRERLPLESETIPADPVDWITSCEKLSKKSAIRNMINQLRRDLASTESLIGDNSSRRRASSVGSAGESGGGSRTRARSSSFLSESDKDRKMSSSERCIMLTTKMDLSTRELVQAKYDCLSREIRGLKKRLSQISKLEGLYPEDDAERASMLSSEQKEKIARRPQLESELCIFEPALARVEKRMLQFNLRPRRLSAVCDQDPSESAAGDQPENVIPSPDMELEKKAFTKNVEPTANESLEDKPCASLRCNVCKITCPDDKSYTLHINGRKHRNRVAQEAEEEKKRAAASMMEQQNREKMNISTTERCRVHVSAASSSPSPWNKATQPKYNLPKLANTAQEIVETKQKPKKTLQQIMEEEAKMSAGKHPKVGRATFASARGLQLPPGASPPLKSPPWGTKGIVQSPRTVPSPHAWLSATPAAPALQLPKDAASPLKSPPWATKPVKAVSGIATTSLQMPSPPGKVPKVASSFGDFLQRPPVTPKQSAKTGPAWSSPVPSKSFAQEAPPSAVSFHDIQKQEEEFKTVQDCSYQDNGKWFIERRERAGSLSAIQAAATKEREEQLLIEEQKRIEEQIMRDVALQKKREERKQRQQAKKAKQKSKKEASKQSQGDDDGVVGKNAIAPGNNNRDGRRGQQKTAPKTNSGNKSKSRNNQGKKGNKSSTGSATKTNDSMPQVAQG